MKMVKSLLLGSAAGLVAIAGAQAADLPVKAKPVQYVKICSLYGVGFYYIPGTDTCIKMGGYIRNEWNENSNGSFASWFNGANALHTRTEQELTSRSRGVISWDIRSQTEYGTLRAYMDMGIQWTTGDPTVGGSVGTVYNDRIFIQLAGFTFGKTVSFFNFVSTPAFSNQTNFLWDDTGGSGTPVIAYTAQFGNGLSASVSAEDRWERVLPVVLVPTGGAGLYPLGATNPSSASGTKVPDLVANLHLDQAWGSAQIQGALHNNSATYYTGVNQTAHPSDVIGWAFGGGLDIKVPMLGKTDHLTVAANYCEGATRYCSSPGAATNAGAGFGLVNTTTVGTGWFDDAYYNNATRGSLELPHVWSAFAGYSHDWNAKWNTSLYGGYLDYQANSNAVDTLICPNVVNFTGPVGQPAGCADWSAWQIGSRTTWHVVENFDMSLEAMYTKVNTAFEGGNVATATQGLPPNLKIADTDMWSGILRFQRNFYP